MKSLFITAMLLLSLCATSMAATPNTQYFWIDCKPETSPAGDGSSEANAFHLGAEPGDCPNDLAYKFDKVMRTIAKQQALGRPSPYNGSTDNIHIYIAPGYYYTYGTYTNLSGTSHPVYDAANYFSTPYPDPNPGLGFRTMPGWHIYGSKTNLVKVTLVDVNVGQHFTGALYDKMNIVFGHAWTTLTYTNSISDITIQCNGRELSKVHGDYIGLKGVQLYGASVSLTNLTVLQGMGTRLIGNPQNYYYEHAYLISAGKEYTGSQVGIFNFVGCKVDDFVNGGAVGIASPGYGHKNILVDNNYINLGNTNDTGMCFGTHGIDVIGSTNAIISHNIVKGCKVAINDDTANVLSTTTMTYNSYRIDQNRIFVPKNSGGIALLVATNTLITRNEISLLSSNSVGLRIGGYNHHAIHSIPAQDVKSGNVWVTNNVVFGPGGPNAYAVHCDPYIPGFTHVGCTTNGLQPLLAGNNISIRDNCFGTNLDLAYPGTYTVSGNYTESPAFSAIEEASCDCVFRLSYPQ